MTSKTEIQFSKKIHEKWNKGGALSDAELDAAIEYYKGIFSALRCTGYVPLEYKIFLAEIRTNLYSLMLSKRLRETAPVPNQSGWMP